MASNANSKTLQALIDTNVVLDWLYDRKPWSDDAKPLWDARSAGTLIAYIPASTLTDIFYIARRLADISSAFAALDRLLNGFGFITVDEQILRQARSLSGNDFEDNVQIICAQMAGIDLIVTCNISDFKHSPIPAIEPPDIVRYLPQP